MQTLPSGKHFVAGHQDVVLEMIEAAAIGEEEWAKNSGRYNQYTSSIDHHTHAMVRGGLLAVSGTGVVTGELSPFSLVKVGIQYRGLSPVPLKSPREKFRTYGQHSHEVP